MFKVEDWPNKQKPAERDGKFSETGLPPASAGFLLRLHFHPEDGNV
jgi:hypothetical protein